MAAVSVILRFWFLRRLFPAFRFVPHALRALAPTVPAAGFVLLVRALDPGGHSAGMAVAQLAGYVLVTAAATWAFERDLIREMSGYLVRARGLRTTAAA